MSTPTSKKVSGPDINQPVDENPPVGAATASGGFSYWLLLVGLLLVGWAATALILLRKLRAGSALKEPLQARILQRGGVLKQLKLACGSGDLLAIKQAVLQWSAAMWPDDSPLTLVELAQRLDDRDLSELLRAIDAAIYSGNQAFEMADLDTLAASLAGLRKKHSAQSHPQDSPLPEL